MPDNNTPQTAPSSVLAEILAVMASRLGVDPAILPGRLGSNEHPNAIPTLLVEALAESASLTDVQVAELLGCSTSALRNARSLKKGPWRDLPYHKIGKGVRYSLKDILEFQKKFRVEPNATHTA